MFINFLIIKYYSESRKNKFKIYIYIFDKLNISKDNGTHHEKF